MANKEEKIVANWSGLDTAVSKFLVFLKDCSKHKPFEDWHVVFSLGTVARVCNSFDEITVYPKDRDIGTHRLPNKEYLKELEAKNEKTFQTQSKIPNEVGKAIRRAYKLLYTDGYPYPGGEGSD